MENIKAQNLLNKIHRDLNRNGIIINTIVEELKELRALVVEEGNPLLAKVIRLTYEHIQANEGFEIPIPEDEPLEDEVAEETEQTSGEESLDYLFSLMADPSNKVNEIELREYVKAFQEYE
ncbi:hypothetical protein RM553_02775 [Zunongwangia sp. F363]|uniref:Uncharacterized protein n=1 Tax=Autumnicola tepida TaxID=3075595 RepID=A0ABU3C5X6_9FLAO|nr:hypothetical protein [Zunongwangia sp. F363]MDT0641746.1 hypothetical protein [Zunongwangia sp. F363]